MESKQVKEYKCVLLDTARLYSTEQQLNELFKDGWQFYSVFTAGLANGGTAEYAVVYR